MKKLVIWFLLIIYAVVYCNVMFNVIKYQEGSFFSVWFQIIAVFCFLASCLYFYKCKKFILSGLTGSLVLFFLVSIVISL